MILEHAVLQVRQGEADRFEEAWIEARPLMEKQAGCLNVSLHRSLEWPDHYLLLVAWDSVEAHVDGFRKSPEYGRWSEFLHGFYELAPTVEHFVSPGAHPQA